MVFAKLISTLRTCSFNSAFVSACSAPARANNVRKGIRKLISSFPEYNQRGRAKLPSAAILILLRLPFRARSRMFLSVKELEIKKVRFAVTFPPGEIAYDQGLHQVVPLEVEGSAELLAHTLGEIRIQGHLKVTMATECDRCLETAEFPIDSNFD